MGKGSGTVLWGGLSGSSSGRSSNSMSHAGLGTRGRGAGGGFDPLARDEVDAIAVDVVADEECVAGAVTVEVFVPDAFVVEGLEASLPVAWFRNGFWKAFWIFFTFT